MDIQLVDTILEYVINFLGVSLLFFVLFIWYKAIQMRNKERLMLIEKGMDPILATNKLRTAPTPKNVKDGAILWISIAIGLLAGYLLTIITTLPDFISYASMITLFGGVTIIVSYYIQKKHKSDIEQ